MTGRIIAQMAIAPETKMKGKAWQKEKEPGEEIMNAKIKPTTVNKIFSNFNWSIIEYRSK